MKTDQPPVVARFICNVDPSIPDIPGVVVAPGIAAQVDRSNQLGNAGWAAAVPTDDVTYKGDIDGATHIRVINARAVNDF